MQSHTRALPRSGVAATAVRMRLAHSRSLAHAPHSPPALAHCQKILPAIELSHPSRLSYPPLLFPK
eukprot:273342-Chlamydomonas_euryale.AAC.5